MTRVPRRVASALKLAAEHAHLQVGVLKANMRRYSSNERPHGTTWSSVNIAV